MAIGERASCVLFYERQLEKSALPDLPGAREDEDRVILDRSSKLRRDPTGFVSPFRP